MSESMLLPWTAKTYEVYRAVCLERDALKAQLEAVTIEKECNMTAKLIADRDAGQKACAEMRESLQHVLEFADLIDDETKLVKHALSSSSGKGFIHVSELGPTIATHEQVISFMGDVGHCGPDAIYMNCVLKDIARLEALKEKR